MPPVKDSPHAHRVYVTGNGWHTAIIVSAAALVAERALPETADFPNASFLEFGWGDRTFYPAEEPTLGVALTAALIPTPAVMHIAELQAPPAGDSSELDVISLELTKSGFRSLVRAIAEEFERPDEGRAEPVSRGLYSHSHFYHARGKFHLFNTCNTWTARMLHEGGVDVSPSGIVTAHGLMSRLREISTDR